MKKTIELQSLIKYVPEPMCSFLEQPLTLGVFVPCDSEGNVLEKPKNYDEWLKKKLNTPYELDLNKYEQYQQALDRVVFEGFEVTVDSDTIIRVYHKELKIMIDLYDNRFDFRKLDSFDYAIENSNKHSISDLCGYGLKVKMR